MKQAALTQFACRVVTPFWLTTTCGYAATTLVARCAGGTLPRLYEVVDRKCENPLAGQSYCLLT